MIQNNPEHLRVTNISPCRIVDNASHLKPGFHKATANQPLWIERGELLNPAGLKLERALIQLAYKDDIPYKLASRPNLPLPYAIEAWIQAPTYGLPETPPPDKDELNELLLSDSVPSVNVTPSPLGPNLLLCHRSVPFGDFLKGSIQRIRGVVHADIIQTGEGAPGIFCAYAKGALLGATVDPALYAYQAIEDDIYRLATT